MPLSAVGDRGDLGLIPSCEIASLYIIFCLHGVKNSEVLSGMSSPTVPLLIR